MIALITNNLKKMIFASLLMLSPCSLQGATPLCPVSNHVTLTCQDVVMEAYWVRLSSDINTLFVLNSGNPADLFNALNTNAAEVYGKITDMIAVNIFVKNQLLNAFGLWRTALYNFYLSPTDSNQSFFRNQAQNLVGELINAYSLVLPATQQSSFNNQLAAQFKQYTDDIVALSNYFSTGDYINGLGAGAASVLKEGAYIGVFLGKALEGNVI